MFKPDESESEDESVGEVMSELVSQMQKICEASSAIDSKIIDLYARAKSETTVWMHEPLKPIASVRAWCAKHRLSERPTIDELSTAIFTAAQSLDYESRILTFRREDANALWGGQQRLSIYDVIAKVPALFC